MSNLKAGVEISLQVVITMYGTEEKHCGTTHFKVLREPYV